MLAPRTARDRLDRILSILMRATRFWLPAVVVVVLGSLTALGFAFTRTRIYKSETLMLYREGIRSSDVAGGEGGADPARKLGLKLKEMVLSRTRLQQIIDENKLYREIIEDRGYVDAVDEMRKHIAFRVKDGDTFGLSFEGDDPVRVQSITARLAEALIAENSKQRMAQAEATKDFIDAERRRAEDDVRDKESTLAKFLAKHPEFAREGQNQASRAAASSQSQKGSSKTSDPTLLALEREAARIQERLGMPVAKRKDKDSDPALVAVKSEAETDLRNAQRELEAKLGQFTEQHPDVRAAKAKVKAAEAKLKAARDALAAGDSKPKADDPDEGIIDRATLESQLAKVNEEISSYKKRKRENGAAEPKESTGANWIVQLEAEWSQLNRDVNDARSRFSGLQDKQFRATMVESVVTSGRNAQIAIIDPAFKPTHPSKPSRTLLAMAGILIAIGLGLGLSLGLALMDDRLYDRVDVEQLELAPLVGVVPRAPVEKGARRG